MLKNEPIVKEKPKNPRKKQQTKLFVFAVLGILVLTAIPLYFLLPKEDSFRLIDYTYSEVMSRTFKEYVPVVGQILAEREINITAPFKGEIISVNVKTGDEIEKDALILQLDSDELSQNIGNNEEEVKKTLTDLNKAKLDLDIETYRYDKILLDLEKTLTEAQNTLQDKEELYAYGEISQKALADAKEALKATEIDNMIRRLTAEKNLLAAEATHRQTKNQFTRAEDRLLELKELEKQKTILSPIRGKVLEVLFDPGGNVATNTVLVKMATLKNPYVDVMIPVAESAKVEVGMPAVVKTPTTDYPGYIDRVSFDVKHNQQIGYYVAGVVRFLEDPGFILPYTECRVEIETGRREDVLYLPRGPYISTGQSMFVYKITDSKAIKTDVIFGSFDGTDVEVIQGLSVGDRIISSSYDRFSEYHEIDINTEGGRKL
ncbi:MAG: efflux RND transporter periplasmic adaptor subunit [Firmicutes bacterium]|nr:efflux RND transporter periplasmic adaptor subunit [Bacillota bacterium]MDD4264371.1 efflux RND transporter periplasmic adaptor subunit [Bacillota bacterium]MDD4693885.1 efflux RND transporter periplasmic adaptor subunit [Bacillota bacterium]